MNEENVRGVLIPFAVERDKRKESPNELPVTAISLPEQRSGFDDSERIFVEVERVNGSFGQVIFGCAGRCGLFQADFAAFLQSDFESRSVAVYAAFCMTCFENRIVEFGGNLKVIFYD